MQTPTTAQLRTAIEVLKKLGERIDKHATHSLMQLPDTRLGDDHAARIECPRHADPFGDPRQIDDPGPNAGSPESAGTAAPLL